MHGKQRKFVVTLFFTSLLHVTTNMKDNYKDIYSQVARIVYTYSHKLSNTEMNQLIIEIINIIKRYGNGNS